MNIPSDYEQINKIVEAKDKVIERVKEAANTYFGCMIDSELKYKIEHSIIQSLYQCYQEGIIPKEIWHEPVVLNHQQPTFHDQICIILPEWLMDWLKSPPNKKVEEILKAPKIETEVQKHRRFEMNVVLADVPSIDHEES